MRSLLLFLFLILAWSDVEARNSTRYLSRLRTIDGPHVCTVEEIDGMDIRFHIPWTGGRLCGKDSVIIYDCCEGYAMLPATLGCALVLPLESMIQTMIATGAGEFANLATNAGLGLSLTGTGVFTILAPIDKGFEYPPEDSDEEIHSTISTRYGTGPAILFYHLIDKRIRTDDLQGGEAIIPSLYNGRNIRFNTHMNGLVTANCVPLIRRDYQTKNGVVHTVAKTLHPGVPQTIMDFILGDHNYGKMATMLVQASLTNLLRETGPFTVFLPDDEAFSKLPGNFLQDILYDEETVKAVTSYHIAKGIHCAATLTSRGRVLSMEGSPVTPSCIGSNRSVDHANLIKEDLMASNGFVHVIDEVLIPTRAKRMKHILKEKGLNIFLRLLERIKPDPLQDVPLSTIFAPTDKAFRSLDNDTQWRLENDITWLTEVIKGHITPGRLSIDSLTDLQKVDTLQPGRILTIKLYRELVVVDLAVLTRGDYDGRDGTIHVIDHALIPPVHTVGEYLKTVENFTLFTEALNATNDQLLDMLGSGVGGPWTVLAVDNANIQNLNAELATYNRMVDDPAMLKRILSNHIIKDLVIVSGLRLQNYYRFVDYKYEPVLVHRESVNQTSIGIANVERPDILCTNGIVHIVNRIMQRVY